jgi:hypothetical protein
MILRRWESEMRRFIIFSRLGGHEEGRRSVHSVIEDLCMTFTGDTELLFRH